MTDVNVTSVIIVFPQYWVYYMQTLYVISTVFLPPNN